MQLFLDRFEHIKDIGAVAASSRFLASKIVALAEIGSHHTIAEIGPGDGVFTKEISRYVTQEQKFFTVEKDNAFYAHMQHTYPDVVTFHGCASDIDTYMKSLDITHIDCVVSSLPRAIFDETLQKKILDALYASLAPGAIFLTFSYVHTHYFSEAMVFHEQLKKRFTTVQKSDIVRLNIPPAFVYVCRK